MQAVKSSPIPRLGSNFQQAFRRTLFTAILASTLFGTSLNANPPSTLKNIGIGIGGAVTGLIAGFEVGMILEPGSGGGFMPPLLPVFLAPVVGMVGAIAANPIYFNTGPRLKMAIFGALLSPIAYAIIKDRRK